MQSISNSLLVHAVNIGHWHCDCLQLTPCWNEFLFEYNDYDTVVKFLWLAKNEEKSALEHIRTIPKSSLF